MTDSFSFRCYYDKPSPDSIGEFRFTRDDSPPEHGSSTGALSSFVEGILLPYSLAVVFGVGFPIARMAEPSRFYDYGPG